MFSQLPKQTRVV